jgi:hypothetical protein
MAVRVLERLDLAALKGLRHLEVHVVGLEEEVSIVHEDVNASARRAHGVQRDSVPVGGHKGIRAASLDGVHGLGGIIEPAIRNAARDAVAARSASPAWITSATRWTCTRR